MERLSATIITLNEERDLPRCLESLRFADEVIVVDSGSQDKTAEIARSFGAKLVIEPWHGYGAQKNFAMKQAKNSWVLNVDADEVITPELREEILKTISDPSAAQGYQIARRTFYMGRWIRHGGWYPNYVTRLARKENSKWTEPFVHEELVVEGGPRRLANPLDHYTFSDIQDQVQTNLRYAKQGAQQLFKKQPFKGGQNKFKLLLKLLVKPLGKFFETYLVKRGFLDGLPGFIISINAAHSMFLKYAYLIEMNAQAGQGNVQKSSDHRQ